VSRTLPAIILAEKILRLSLEIDEEEIEEALEKLGIARGAWGLLWGAEDPGTSGRDAEFYELKAKVLRFIRDLKKEKSYPLSVVLLMRES